MVTLEQACSIVKNDHPSYDIVECCDGGSMYIFGMRAPGDEKDVTRGLRGPFTVHKTTGKTDQMHVNDYLDYILEHGKHTLDISTFKQSDVRERAS